LILIIGISVGTIVVIGGVLTMIGLILIVLGRRESGGAVRQKSDKPIIDTKKELANNYLILDFTPNFSIGNSKKNPNGISKKFQVHVKKIPMLEFYPFFSPIHLYLQTFILLSYDNSVS